MAVAAGQRPVGGRRPDAVLERQLAGRDGGPHRARLRGPDRGHVQRGAATRAGARSAGSRPSAAAGAMQVERRAFEQEHDDPRARRPGRRPRPPARGHARRPGGARCPGPRSISGTASEAISVTASSGGAGPRAVAAGPSVAERQRHHDGRARPSAPRRRRSCGAGGLGSSTGANPRRLTHISSGGDRAARRRRARRGTGS